MTIHKIDVKRNRKVEKAERLHSIVAGSSIESAEAAIALCDVLIDLKVDVQKAGDTWDKWVTQNLSFGPRQARRYASLAGSNRTLASAFIKNKDLESACELLATLHGHAPKPGSGDDSDNTEDIAYWKNLCRVLQAENAELKARAIKAEKEVVVLRSSGRNVVQLNKIKPAPELEEAVRHFFAEKRITAKYSREEKWEKYWQHRTSMVKHLELILSHRLAVDGLGKSADDFINPLYL